MASLLSGSLPDYVEDFFETHYLRKPSTQNKKTSHIILSTNFKATIQNHSPLVFIRQLTDPDESNGNHDFF